MTNNARSEELAAKATYQQPWAKGQRCIIPARSFDEPCWETGKNVWWRFRRSDGALWGLAGLWNTWTDQTFSMEQTACDAKMVMGEAAMKVSGSWSIQNFLDIDESFDFGIFPFPNQTGDAKLLFEPNITFMASAQSALSFCPQ